MGMDLFYRSSCSNLTRQPYKLPQTLKDRHYICYILLSWVSILTTYFPQPTLDPCFLGFLLFQTWANNASGLAFVVILFLYCTARSSKAPLLSEKGPEDMFFSFCPSSPSPVPPSCLSAPFFLLRGGTDWQRHGKEGETLTSIRLMALITLSPVLWGERDAIWRRCLEGAAALKVWGGSGLQHRIESIPQYRLPLLSSHWLFPGAAVVAYRRWSTKS